MRHIAVGQECVQDRRARDEHRPGDVHVTRVVDPHLEVPEDGHRARREDEADQEEPADRADQVSSLQRR